MVLVAHCMCWAWDIWVWRGIFAATKGEKST